jgi:Calponin homology (CH) domain
MFYLYKVYNFSLTNTLPPLTSQRNPLENARAGTEAAEKDLGIPPILQPEDLVSPDVDELSVMTYISYFRDYVRFLQQLFFMHYVLIVILGTRETEDDGSRNSSKKYSPPHFHSRTPTRA